MRWVERQVLATDIMPVTGAVLRAVERDDRRITALHLATRWGDLTVTADSFVDASGDAVLSWLAGLDLQQADADIHGTIMAVFEGVDTDQSDAAGDLSRSHARPR